MAFGILNGDVQPLENDERVAFPLRVGVIERIEDEADAHGGAPLADTLLLHEVTHVHEADEDGRKSDFHFQILAAHDSGELSRVDHDSLEKRRTLRVFRMLPQSEDCPADSLIHVHERILRYLFGHGDRRLFRLRRGTVYGWVMWFLIFDHGFGKGNPLNRMGINSWLTVWFSFGLMPINCRCSGRRLLYWLTV